MPLSPATLRRHELVGLHARVVEADNPALEGIEGRVVDETTNTLLVGGDRARQVPKAGTTFSFSLPDGERVVVEGDRLVARPARRNEATGGTTWHSA